MKIIEFSGASFEFGHSVGIAFELENGNRNAFRLNLPVDTEELPELLAEAGKKIREWARNQKPKD